MEQGHADAQCNLGYCYANGIGVTQDYAEAVKWYQKAAEQGNALGQNNLGYCYESAQGVAQDLAQAQELYAKAAARGNATAQRTLSGLILVRLRRRPTGLVSVSASSKVRQLWAAQC